MDELNKKQRDQATSLIVQLSKSKKIKETSKEV